MIKAAYLMPLKSSVA